MRIVTIELDDVLYAELEAAARAIQSKGFGPAQFAEECVESVLASRRLPRFTRLESRPRMTDEDVRDPLEYRVHLPEMRAHLLGQGPFNPGIRST